MRMRTMRNIHDARAWTILAAMADACLAADEYRRVGFYCGLRDCRQFVRDCAFQFTRERRAASEAVTS